jgi:hypothetical protein
MEIIRIRDNKSFELNKVFIQENLLEPRGLSPTKLKMFKDLPSNEDLYLIFHEKLKPYCIFCKTPRAFKSFKQGYLLQKCTPKCISTKTKVEQTMLSRYGVTNGFQTEQSKSKIFELYGVDNVFNLESVQSVCCSKMKETKSSEEWKETTGKLSAKRCSETKSSEEWKETTGKLSIERLRTARENSGKWIKSENLPDFKRYRRLVWKITNSQSLNSLENFEKRGMRGESFHLDHQFSIFDGFRNNIPPFIIGNLINLKMIHWKENIKKGKTSSIEDISAIFIQTNKLQLLLLHHRT